MSLLFPFKILIAEDLILNGKSTNEESQKFIQSMIVLDNAFTHFKNKELDNARNRTPSPHKSR